MLVKYETRFLLNLTEEVLRLLLSCIRTTVIPLCINITLNIQLTQVKQHNSLSFACSTITPLMIYISPSVQAFIATRERWNGFSISITP
jgi:hypothetical protein